MAELHSTKRVRQLAAVLREEADTQGVGFPDGDFVERMIADRVQSTAQRLRVTPRTVLDSYVTEDEVRRWGTDLAAQLRDAELVAHDAAAVAVDQRDGLLVLAAFGICGMLAVRNAERRAHADPMIVARDAADSTVHIGVALYEAGEAPAPIGGLTVVVGRKVISMALEALRKGWWDCTCGQPHRDDGGCPLQDRLEHDLTVLGGWVNRGESV